MIQYQLRIHREKGAYWGEFPDLPGCFTQGKTRDEALEEAREALSVYLEEARDPMWEVPQPQERKGRNYIWIAPYPEVAVPLMIRTARLKAGLSQKALAGALGISFQQLQKLETPGKSNPTIKTLYEISMALDGEFQLKIA